MAVDSLDVEVAIDSVDVAVDSVEEAADAVEGAGGVSVMPPTVPPNLATRHQERRAIGNRAAYGPCRQGSAQGIARSVDVESGLGLAVGAVHAVGPLHTRNSDG